MRNAQVEPENEGGISLDAILSSQTQLLFALQTLVQSRSGRSLRLRTACGPHTARARRALLPVNRVSQISHN